MSNDIIVAIIGGAFTLFNTIISFVVKGKLNAYHKEVDGMKTELVEAVKGKGEAEGNLQGRLEQTEENKNSSK